MRLAYISDDGMTVSWQSEQWPTSMPVLFCRVYWNSHGCMFERGHEGPHVCKCAVTDDIEWHSPDSTNVGAPPYYGPETHFFGEDA